MLRYPVTSIAGGCALPPERRAVGVMTHSVALINACKPFHWRDKFPPTNAPSPEVTRKARERFGGLLDGSNPNGQ
jgi:4-hydroxy-3-polyprenylbenzoate decarboxylase